LLDDTTCQECPAGFLPNANKTGQSHSLRADWLPSIGCLVGWSSFFYGLFFKNCFLTKKLKLRTDSAASSRGERKLSHFVFPLEAALSNSTSSLLTRQAADVSIHISYDYLPSVRHCQRQASVSEICIFLRLKDCNFAY
jgi:hypothetical protein